VVLSWVNSHGAAVLRGEGLMGELLWDGGVVTLRDSLISLGVLLPLLNRCHPTDHFGP